MLKYISAQKHPNLVEFIEDFEYNERLCLVFELLHMDLLEFTGRYDTCRANLHAVRPIAQQVSVLVEQSAGYISPIISLKHRNTEHRRWTGWLL